MATKAEENMTPNQRRQLALSWQRGNTVQEIAERLELDEQLVADYIWSKLKTSSLSTG